MLKKSIVPDVVFSAHKSRYLPTMDIMFALCLFLISLMFIHETNFFHYDHLSAALLFAVLLSGLIYQLYRFHTMAKKDRYLWSYMTIIILCNLTDWNTTYIKSLNFLYIVIWMAYWFLSCSKHCIKDGHSDWILLDILYALLHAPFYYLNKTLAFLGGLLNFQHHHKDILKVVTGCILSIPILFVILPLLSDADETFSFYLSNIHLDWNIVIEWGFTLMLALPLFLYLFSMSYGNLSHTDVRIYDEQIEIKLLGKLSFIPQTIYSTMELILTIVYLLFMIASAHSILSVIGTSKELFSYAAFAKQGFFELCIICAGNLVLIFLIRLTSQAQNRFSTGIEKCLIVETLLLIISAMTKMGLYIFVYHALTYLRIYASWFMIILFGIFLILLFQKESTRYKILPIIYYVMACILILNISNVSHWASDAPQHRETASVQILEDPY